MTAALACETLLSVVVQVAVLVSATIAVEGRLGSAKAVCRLWTLCFLAILGFLAMALLLPHFRWLAVPDVMPGTAVVSIVAWQAAIMRGCTLLWAIGLVFLLVGRGMRCIQLMRFLESRCRPLSGDEVAALPITEQDAALPVRWLVSTAVSGPFCWQLHRPTIVLPASLLREPPSALRQILMHELEHLRTNHPLQHFLQGVCGALLWFHPAVWWAGRRAELAREYVCDEVAATQGGTIAEYLRTLARVAEHIPRPPAGGLQFGAGESAIVRRCRRLVRLAESPSRSSRPRDMLALLIWLLAVISATQLWLPVNPLASSRSHLSPWPNWTAGALHDVGLSLRDFERFDEHHGLHEFVAPGH